MTPAPDMERLTQELEERISRVEDCCEKAVGAVEKYLRRMAVDDARLALKWGNRNLMLRAILNLNDYLE